MVWSQAWADTAPFLRIKLDSQEGQNQPILAASEPTNVKSLSGVILKERVVPHLCQVSAALAAVFLQGCWWLLMLPCDSGPEDLLIMFLEVQLLTKPEFLCMLCEYEKCCCCHIHTSMSQGSCKSAPLPGDTCTWQHDIFRRQALTATSHHTYRSSGEDFRLVLLWSEIWKIRVWSASLWWIWSSSVEFKGLKGNRRWEEMK